MLRPDPRSALTGSVRVANQAGAAPKITPVTSARPNANASTIGDGQMLMGRKRALRKARTSSSCAAATATPAATPAVATSSGNSLRDFGCIGCHGLDGSPAGGNKGPSLVGKKLDPAALSSGLVKAHADTSQNLTLGQIKALASELAAGKSGS